MRLYVVRHGEAEPQSSSDEARALTDRGREDVRGLWQALAARGEVPGPVYSSPYLRARQTAAEICTVYRRELAGLSELLVPDGRPQEVFDWLLGLPQVDGMMLVSHMPLVGHLVGRLADGPDARVPMGVGSVALLDVEVPAVGGGRLIWLRSPGESL